MTIGILERASGLLSGQSRATSIASEPLPVTQILRNPQKMLLVPGPHIEDILLLEPFVHAVKEQSPDSYLALVAPRRLVPLPEKMACFDRIFAFELDGVRGRSKDVEELGRTLRAEDFDVALALTYEADAAVGVVTSVSGAKLRIGCEGLESQGISLNVVLRRRNEEGSYGEKMAMLFSLIGVKPPARFRSLLTEERGRSTASLPEGEPHQEPGTGFFFDQADPLDMLKGDELERVIRVIVTRRAERSVLAGFGLRERDTKALVSDGVEIIENASVVELARFFCDCSWTVTNSLGFAALLGRTGARVILLGKPSRLKKYPVGEIPTVTFLPVVSGKVLLESLVRFMERGDSGE
jgi:ADP-heptose:LPS heptosyltransferase